MFKLLQIKISGFRMLADNFIIELTNKKNVVSTNQNKEIIEIDTNLYTFNTIALTGSNSSGKTSTLAAINMVLYFMKTGRWPYTKKDFNSDYINIELYFYLNKKIYKYSSKIMRGNVDDGIEMMNSFSKIKDELLLSAKYTQSTGKKYHTLNFAKEDGYTSTIEDTSILVLLCKDEFVADYIAPFSNMIGYTYNKTFFDTLNLFEDKLTNSVIQLLDESIEYLKSNSNELVRLKRFGSEETIMTKNELLGILSNGTIKGIELYLRIIKTIKVGGIILIDEIENCFHKNLVSNILFLLQDESINSNGAQIIFSTHYVEILDVLDRQDDIFILSKNNNKIEIKNLATAYPSRLEILKSKRFNENTFNTLLNYNKLMEVKREIANEISRND